MLKLYLNGTVVAYLPATAATLAIARKKRDDNVKKRLEQGLPGIERKRYRMNGACYRRVFSQVLLACKKSSNKCVFFTLTFPPFINGSEISEQDANKCFSRFMQNLKNTYRCDYYVAVRERGEIGNRLHYHVLATMPYNDYRLLNDAWCSAIREYCYYSKCALTTRKKRSIVNNGYHAARYVCKYFGKTYGQESDTPIVFSSKVLANIALTTDCYSVQDLIGSYKYKVSYYDYYAVYKIDKDDMQRYLRDIMYPNILIDDNAHCDFISVGLD